MSDELLKKIRDNPIIYSMLREDSTLYMYLYRDENFINEVERLAKIKYKLTMSDKLERLQKKLELINTLFSVMD